MISSDDTPVKTGKKPERGGITDFEIIDMLKSQGIELYDPRLNQVREIIGKLTVDKSGARKINPSAFNKLFSERKLLQQILHKQQVIPDFKGFKEIIKKIYEQVSTEQGGKVATYIPQLASINPKLFAISVCTVDGQVFSIGDSEVKFSLQSAHKPVNYALALEQLGEAIVHKHVGKEPSGVSFNALTLNSEGLPHNPLINAGAIMCSALIERDMAPAAKFDLILDIWKGLDGITSPTFNNSVYLSEKNTADRNFALAYFMRENGAFPQNTEVTEVLDFYFQCCSIESTTSILSRVAATFANSGVNPFTNQKVFDPETVKSSLSLMHSCGMYDYSGQFSFSIGLPAKSGVSGCIWIVVPNLMGIAVYAPPLDQNGNSVKGIRVAEELIKHFNFHHYDSLRTGNNHKKDPRLRKYESRVDTVMSLVFAASAGDLDEIKRLQAIGVNLDQPDYDGRTALHLAASENQSEVVKYLLDNGVNKAPVDRWGSTPLKDAKRAKHGEIISLLSSD